MGDHELLAERFEEHRIRLRAVAPRRGRRRRRDGDGGEAIIEGAPALTGTEAQVTQAGEYRFFAGWRSEFFFSTRAAP